METLKAAYNEKQWARLVLCLLTILGAVILIALSGGFPPWAWIFLISILPRITMLWAAHGLAILPALIGLLLLSLALLTLWVIIIVVLCKIIYAWWKDFYAPQSLERELEEAELIAERMVMRERGYERMQQVAAAWQPDASQYAMFENPLPRDMFTPSSMQQRPVSDYKKPVARAGAYVRSSVAPAYSAWAGPGASSTSDLRPESPALPERSRQMDGNIAPTRGPQMRERTVPVRAPQPGEDAAATGDLRTRGNVVPAPANQASVRHQLQIVPRGGDIAVETRDEPEDVGRGGNVAMRGYSEARRPEADSLQLPVSEPPSIYEDEEIEDSNYETLPELELVSLDSGELSILAPFTAKVPVAAAEVEDAIEVPAEAAPIIYPTSNSSKKEQDKVQPVEGAMKPADPVPDEQSLRLMVGIGLDPGIARKDSPNEDNLFAIQGMRMNAGSPQPAGLFVVADGMGGHSNGQEASHMAAQIISDIAIPTLMRNGSDDDAYLDLLKDGVHRANLAIYQRNRNRDEAQVGMMGTTVTAALVVGTTAYIVNVGDSRTYLYRPSEGLRQVTRDHSIVARLVEDGTITAEEIYTHPRRNMIYRCLGDRASLELDARIETLQTNDMLILCSDGLWEMVRDPDIERILAASAPHASQISSLLVQAALSRGGADNISVIVVSLLHTET